jgi:pimeloyl-ACP methyl ester carboxylesterase
VLTGIWCRSSSISIRDGGGHGWSSSPPTCPLHDPVDRAGRSGGRPDRRRPGPLLIISGEKDHTIPHSLAHAAYQQYKHNPGVTEFIEMPDRGHALVIDSGLREVAQTVLNFIDTHVPHRDHEGEKTWELMKAATVTGPSPP